jgi:LPXTG-motif cell wall-anchored protein
MKRTKVLALGFSTALCAAGAAIMPAAAWADSTTTTCTPSTYPLVTCPPTYGGSGGSITPPVDAPAPSAIAFSNASSGALPFTGADIEQMAAVGGTALVLGSVLVARKRRRARA